MKINCCGKTDVGRKRSNNEDALIVKPELNFLAVADGMGGQASGEVASKIFIDTTLELFSAGEHKSEQETRDLIQDAFILANQRILKLALDNPRQKGMGCTGELIAFYENKHVIGHVGDSRAYVLRNGKLLQLTRDHSYIQEEIDNGRITEEEAKVHPHRNVISRAVGVKDELAVDLINGECSPGDIFLLCSDGLTGMVSDTDIEKTLLSSSSLPRKVENLIDSANSAGGKDNVTVALCEVLLGGEDNVTVIYEVQK